MLWVSNDKARDVPRQVDEAEAEFANDAGMGVFWTPNTHTGRRLRENLLQIRYWFCELDGADKVRQAAALRSSPLRPTRVVESRNGYHCYWAATDASPDTWDRIVKRGIIPALGADPKASDILRILRAPNYYHHKQEPYLVQVVWDTGRTYSTKQMLEAFPEKKPEARRAGAKEKTGEGFWWALGEMDAGDVLMELNGRPEVRGETFELDAQANGNRNIILDDGTDSGCFVRPDGSLGGVEGGPSIAHWCRYYGLEWSEIATLLKELYPELEKY